MKELPLSDLPVGRAAYITRITERGAAMRRLTDLGIIAGAKVRAVYESTFGDPIAYRVQDSVFAMRKQDAKKIFCEEWTHETPHGASKTNRKKTYRCTCRKSQCGEKHRI